MIKAKTYAYKKYNLRVLLLYIKVTFKIIEYLFYTFQHYNRITVNYKFLL